MSQGYIKICWLILKKTVDVDVSYTTQEMKFSIKDFSNKSDQIWSFLCSGRVLNTHLLLITSGFRINPTITKIMCCFCNAVNDFYPLQVNTALCRFEL